MSHAYIYVLCQDVYELNPTSIWEKNKQVSRYREISDNILFYLYVDILLLYSILDSPTASHNTFQINWTDLLMVTDGIKLMFS